MDNNYISGSVTTSGPARESELSRVLSRLHKSVSIAQSLFGELTERITPVLRGDKADLRENKPSVPEFSTSLAQELNVIVGQVDDLNSYIGSIKNRVEL